MSVVNGTDVGLYVDNQLIGCLTSNDVNLTKTDIDVTCKDNGGARQTLPGGKAADFPFSGNFNPASGFGFTDLLSIYFNDERVGIKQAVDGGLYISCYAYLPELTWTAPLNAASVFSGTFKSDGSITYGEET